MCTRTSGLMPGCRTCSKTAPSLPSAKPDMRGSASSAGMPVAQPKHCCSQVADIGRNRRSLRSYLQIIQHSVIWHRQAIMLPSVLQIEL